MFPLTDVFSGTVRGFYYRGVGHTYKGIEGPKSRLAFIPPFYKKADAVFVCEGPFDMYAVWRQRRLLGFPNATAIAIVGAHVTPEQTTFISDYPRIIWALDRDYAGEKEMRKAKPLKARQYVLEYDSVDGDPDKGKNFRVVDYNPMEAVRLPGYLRR